MVECDPLEARFTHDAISSSFRNDGIIDQTIDDALEGRLDVSRFPRFDLVRYFDGHVYSLSNRRLFVFRVLRVLGKVVSLPGMLDPMMSDRVQRKKMDPRNGSMESKRDRAFSTKNSGLAVKVRGSSKYNHLHLFTSKGMGKG